MILAEQQNAGSLCWHVSGRGCRHRTGVPTAPGRGSVSSKIELYLPSPITDQSQGRKSSNSSLETPWMNFEACFAQRITAERAAGITSDAGPHIPAELCSCRGKSRYISGRRQHLWEGDPHQVGGPWGAETQSPFLQVCGCRFTHILCSPGSAGISGWQIWLFLNNSRDAASKPAAFPVHPVFCSRWHESMGASAGSAVGTWSEG